MSAGEEADLGFTLRVRKSGEVAISRAGSVVTILRGAAAHALCARLAGLDAAAVQQALARATGNYKRGNEKAQRRSTRHR